MPLARTDADTAGPPDGFLSPIPVGLELDSGEWAWLDAFDDLSFLPIAGPARSGRSTALAFLSIAARTRGWNVVRVGHSRRSPLVAFFDDDNGDVRHIVVDEIGDTLENTPGNILVLVDDLRSRASSTPRRVVVGTAGGTRHVCRVG